MAQAGQGDRQIRTVVVLFVAWERYSSARMPYAQRCPRGSATLDVVILFRRGRASFSPLEHEHGYGNSAARRLQVIAIHGHKGTPIDRKANAGMGSVVLFCMSSKNQESS